MPTSTTSRSSFGLLRPAVAAAALMACALAAQAADPLAPATDTVNNAVTGAKTIANGKTTANGQVNAATGTNVDINGDTSANANASADTKADVNASKDGKAVSDSWITTKVKSELVANSATKGLKVHVTTKGGVVALKGKLPSQEAIDSVKSLAVNVKGVQSVDASGLVVAGS